MKTPESMLKRGDLHWANLLLCSCGSGVGEQRWTPAQIRSPWGIGRRATGAGLEPGLLSGSGVSCNGSQSLPDSKEHFWPLVFTSTAFPFKFLEWTCRVYRSLLRSLHSFKDFSSTAWIQCSLSLLAYIYVSKNISNFKIYSRTFKR